MLSTMSAGSVPAPTPTISCSLTAPSSQLRAGSGRGAAERRAPARPARRGSAPRPGSGAVPWQWQCVARPWHPGRSIRHWRCGRMDRDQMRASESDRQVVMERLRQAVEEGRLDVGEYQDRVDAAMSARVYSELDVLISDLQQLPPPGFQEASMEPTQVMRPQPLSKVNQQLREEAEAGPRKWKIAGVAVAIAAAACLVIFMLSPELFLYIAIGVLVVLVLFVVAAFSGLF
ncbi:DUF1707 domain-containing protein [Glycomyces sp. NEAU-7082]|uniref:DUF1707 domain-containing protein n=2 Tax=Glycomyces albidus TaxID=2656774 RepID=A0A6L5GAH9_9ACTN|nr:DUF1707 domain-containing protein [Glycomyces albidus]